MNMIRNLRRSQGFLSRASTLAEADVARDRGRWAEAARGYRRHLLASPEDAGIWIQLAHMLKELGEFEQARDAYEKASEHAPSDPDPHLHRAHLLKRMDRPRQAELAFLELMRLAPTREVMDELGALGLGTPGDEMAVALPAAATRVTYVEIKDLLNHIENHATLTGISRVVLGLVHHLVEEMDEDVAASYAFVSQCDGGDRLAQVPKGLVRGVVRAAMSPADQHGIVKRLVAEARQTAQPVTLGRGDVYLIPGAFWLACGDPGLFPRLRRDGVLIGAYLYDLIPVTHAQYCEASLTRTFAVALGETLPFLDFCLTISAFVAGELRAFLLANDLPSVPILSVPLAHEMRLGPGPRRTVPHRTVGDVLVRPFVLCVCTIEARKNHAYLLAVWHRMIEEGIDVPDLVFVGRIGWRVADLLAQIDASRNLDGRLHILQGVSDADLSALYEGCLFTVFPSFVEGWGLPVGESLSHGKVCVASSASSIPEVGGDLCTYLDPFSVESGYAAISGLVKDPARLAALEAKLRVSFRARTWTDLGRDFFAKLDALVADLDPDARARFAPGLRAGTFLRMQRLMTTVMGRPDYVRNPMRLVFDSGWRCAEATGTWLDGPRARLTFRTDYGEGREIVITLHLGNSPWVSEVNAIQLWATDPLPRRSDRDSDFHVTQRLHQNADFWIRMKGRVGPDGFATVHFLVEGPVVAEGDSIPVAVRLYAVGYAASDDIAARMDLMESRNLCAA